MAKLKISDYSSTSAGANLNTDINSIDIDEGCAPSGINNAIRTLMAQLKDFQTGVSGDSLTLGGALSGTSATFSGNVTASAISGVSMTLSDDIIFTGTGNRITGEMSSSTLTNNLSFQSSTANDVSIMQMIPNGTGTSSQHRVYNNSDINNSGFGQFFVNSSEVRVLTGTTGTGTPIPLLFSTSSSERMRIDTSGNVGIGTTSPTNKLSVVGADASVIARVAGASYAVTMNSDAGSGFRIEATDPTGLSSYQPLITNGSLQVFRTGNTERMRIDSGGNVGIGTTSIVARISSQSATSNNTSKAIQLNNSSGTELLAIVSDGAMYTGSAAASPNNNTTGAGANVYIGTFGQLFRSTSSLKYKTDVQNATHGLAEVLELRPVIYKTKNDGNKVFGGLIAEEVDELGLTEFVQYAKDGNPDALHYGNMVSLAFKAIQEQQDIIKALEARIATLENK